jgi:hypothetical protein
MVAQTIHAAGESSPGNLPDDTRAIALACKDEAELLVYEQKLIAAGIPHKTIREPDAPYFGAAMTIGIFPRPRAELRPLLSNLPLLK